MSNNLNSKNSAKMRKIQKTVHQVLKIGGISVDRLNKKGYELCMLSKYSWQAATF